MLLYNNVYEYMVTLRKYITIQESVFAYSKSFKRKIPYCYLSDNWLQLHHALLFINNQSTSTCEVQEQILKCFPITI